MNICRSRRPARQSARSGRRTRRKRKNPSIRKEPARAVSTILSGLQDNRQERYSLSTAPTVPIAAGTDLREQYIPSSCSPPQPAANSRNNSRDNAAHCCRTPPASLFSQDQKRRHCATGNPNAGRPCLPCRRKRAERQSPPKRQGYIPAHPAVKKQQHRKSEPDPGLDLKISERYLFTHNIYVIFTAFYGIC